MGVKWATDRRVHRALFWIVIALYGAFAVVATAVFFGWRP